MVNLHLQVTNMLHIGVSKAHINVKKLREVFEKTKNKVKIEREMVQSREKRVREMEQNIIQLRSDPNQVEHGKKVLEDKDREIMVMNRKIKEPEAYPVQTAEMIATSQEK